MYGFVSLVILVGILILGNIFDMSGGDNYKVLIMFCGVVYIVSMVFFVIVRVISVGWRI